MSKGQVFSTDLIFAVSVFLIVLSVIWYVSDTLEYDINRKLELNELENVALRVSDVLVMSPGVPENWVQSPDDAGSIGLADLPRHISGDKLAAFMSISYETQKEKLGMGRFEFWLAIREPGGAVIDSIGLEPVGDYQVGIARPVIEGGADRILNLVVWENYTISQLPYITSL